MTHPTTVSPERMRQALREAREYRASLDEYEWCSTGEVAIWIALNGCPTRQSRLPALAARLVAAVDEAVEEEDIPASITSGPEWAAFLCDVARAPVGDEEEQIKLFHAVIDAAWTACMRELQAPAVLRDQDLGAAIAALERGDQPHHDVEFLVSPLAILIEAREIVPYYRFAGQPAVDIVEALVQTAFVASILGGEDEQRIWRRLDILKVLRASLPGPAPREDSAAPAA